MRQKIVFYYGDIINRYIAYEIYVWMNNIESKITIFNYVLATVKLTKNADLNKISCPGHGVEFYLN